MLIVFCRRCGEEIDENSKICQHCGCDVISLEKEELYTEIDSIKENTLDNETQAIKKKSFKKIIIRILFIIALCAIVFAAIQFWPPKIVSQDINAIKGCPEFYGIKFGMDVNEAGENIALKHRCIEGMEESTLFEVSDFNKSSHIIIEDGEVFTLYKKKANDVYVSFNEKYVDGVMIFFSKDKYSLNSIVSLYEKIYGTPSDKSTLGATWKGKYTTVDVIDWTQVPDAEDNEEDSKIVVRYLITENSQFENLSFYDNKIDICRFLDENYIFDKTPENFISGLKKEDDYKLENFSPDGFPGFSQYTLYPKFEYFGINKGYTAIEFTVPSGSDTIDSFSYLFLLESNQATDKVKEIISALKEQYGENDLCDYTSMQYSKLGIKSINHSEMISNISSGIEGIYSVQWKIEKELITFRITIDPQKTSYEGAVAFSKQG